MKNAIRQKRTESNGGVKDINRSARKLSYVWQWTMDWVVEERKWHCSTFSTIQWCDKVCFLWTKNGRKFQFEQTQKTTFIWPCPNHFKANKFNVSLRPHLLRLFGNGHMMRATWTPKASFQMKNLFLIFSCSHRSVFTGFLQCFLQCFLQFIFLLLLSLMSSTIANVFILWPISNKQFTFDRIRGNARAATLIN